jgi:sigma-B regulation protein RsbU (phosphoserine phosphatase)
MAITHAIAHAQPGTHTPPPALIGYLNDRLSNVYTRDGTFITAFYAVLDPQNRTLTYCSAGHNPPRLVRDGKVIPIELEGGLPLGIIDEEQEYQQKTVQLKRGDLLLLYTDGIVEAMAPLRGATQREMFGLERLDPVLLGCSTGTAQQCIDRIRDAVSTFAENALPTDDQTLIAICVK